MVPQVISLLVFPATPVLIVTFFVLLASISDSSGSNIEMFNFEGKEAGRTFEKIIFVNKFTKEPIKEPNQEDNIAQQSQKPELVKEDLSIETVAGGITIKELYANKEKYNDKIVKIKGKVTKFNPSTFSTPSPGSL